ncbi:MAG TPA: hypothetical protein VN369_03380 [Terriglobales bacterium]|nr:hypothetical protein [Terriglobales bacterium]
MEFNEWSNKKKEQRDFELWGASRPLPVAETGRRASGRNLGILKGALPTAQNPLVATGSDSKARAAQPASYEPPYMGVGESLRLGEEPTQPTHWENPKRLRPADVYVAPEKALAPSYPEAYTKNWNLEDIDDATLSHLIEDYTGRRQNRESAGQPDDRFSPLLKLGDAYDTLYQVALSMACLKPPADVWAFPENNEAPPPIGFPNYFGKSADEPADDLYGDSSGDLADDSQTPFIVKNSGEPGELSIDLGIESKSQNGLPEELVIGEGVNAQSARKIGCLSVAIAMALGVEPDKFITTLINNGGYNSNNLLIWSKVDELYGYNRENKSGGFEDTKDSIVEYLEAGIPVIGQIRRSGGGYHYFLITGFNGKVGINDDGSYDLSNVTMDMFTVNDPLKESNKTLTQAVRSSNFNAITAYIPPKTSRDGGGR